MGCPLLMAVSHVSTPGQTHAVGQYDHPSVSFGCPCSSHATTTPPSYVRK